MNWKARPSLSSETKHKTFASWQMFRENPTCCTFGIARDVNEADTRPGCILGLTDGLIVKQ
jgi:hypothetical protein